MPLPEIYASMMRYQAVGKIAEAANVAARILQLTAPPVTKDDLTMRASALASLGLHSYQNKRFGTALDFYFEAVRLVPDAVSLRRILALICLEMSWNQGAQAEISRAALFAPDDPEVAATQGWIAVRTNDRVTAREALERAVELTSRSSISLLRLASFESDVGNHEMARALVREAAAKTDSSDLAKDADNLVGTSLLRENRIEEAIPYMSRATERGNGAAEYNLGCAYFLKGDWARGFKHMEARFRAGIGNGHELKRFGQPMWDGLGEKLKLHLHAEQGLGDSIQFSRFAPALAERGHDVCLEVPASLVSLFARSYPSIQVRRFALDYPGVYGIEYFDAHVPLLSVPHLTEVTRENVPHEPYLIPDPEKVKEWGGSQVGLCWAGGHSGTEAVVVAEVDKRRSIPIGVIRELTRGREEMFISLQTGDRSSEAELLGIKNYAEQIRSFDDTAAIIANLELVITVDTAVAHLAGAMGKPTWLLNRWDSCWRWGLEGDSTPWYPRMKIYRQLAPGHWGGVIQRVARDLA